MTLDNLSRRRVVFIMIGAMTSMLLSVIDSTVVGTAMPKIISDLQGMNHYVWPFTAYMLLSTIGMPIFGKLADIYGRKPIYFIGIITFLIGSALCGLSANMMQLILFRGLQGLGGGILMTISFVIVGDIFSPAERGKYQGLMGSMFGIAMIIGPSLGGFITDNLNWRWVFYVNIPVGIIAIIIMLITLPNFRDESSKRVMDYAGVTTLIIALIPMLLAFTWAGKDYEWLSAQIIGMLAFSAIMLIIFGFIETKAIEPIIPLSLFKNSIFNVSSIAGFLMNAIMYGAFMFIPLFVPGVIGSSATNSGIVTTPMMLSFVVGSVVSGLLMSGTGKYKLLAKLGFILAGTGMVLLTGMSISTTNSQVVINMLFVGAGVGITMPLFSIIIQNAFPDSQLGLVTSVGQFFRNIGGTIGSAVLGSVMLSSMNKGFSNINFGNMPPAIKDLIKNPQVLTNADTINKIRTQLPEKMLGVFDKLMVQVKTVLAGSIHDVFLVGVFISVIALITALFLKEIPLRKKNSTIASGEVNNENFFEKDRPDLAEE